MYLGEAMKHTIQVLAISAALTAAPAFAGSLSDPILEQDIIVTTTEASSSATGTGLVLFMAALMALAASN